MSFSEDECQKILREMFWPESTGQTWYSQAYFEDSYLDGEMMPGGEDWIDVYVDENLLVGVFDDETFSLMAPSQAPRTSFSKLEQLAAAANAADPYASASTLSSFSPSSSATGGFEAGRQEGNLTRNWSSTFFHSWDEDKNENDQMEVTAEAAGGEEKDAASYSRFSRGDDDDEDVRITAVVDRRDKEEQRLEKEAKKAAATTAVPFRASSLPSSRRSPATTMSNRPCPKQRKESATNPRPSSTPRKKGISDHVRQKLRFHLKSKRGQLSADN